MQQTFAGQAAMRLIGRVRKAGRTITVAEGEAWAIRDDGTRKLIATNADDRARPRRHPGMTQEQARRTTPW